MQNFSMFIVSNIPIIYYNISNFKELNPIF